VLVKAIKHHANNQLEIDEVFKVLDTNLYQKKSINLVVKRIYLINSLIIFILTTYIRAKTTPALAQCAKLLA
jgi:hypothetical protein